MYEFKSDELQVAFHKLTELIPHSNWFIAGGSVASTSFNDVDVFFHTEADYKTALSKLDPKATAINTSNATTVYIMNTQIQFICKQFGTPDKMLPIFDLNKSQIALTANRELYSTSAYDKPLHLIYDNMNSESLHRLYKYKYNKDFYLDMVKGLSDYISHIAVNGDVLLPRSYNEASDLMASTAIKNIANLLFKPNCTIIHNLLKTHFPEAFI